ncbi:patatin-like phospholipase family protein [Candidatus Gracilibacteria bacterium]|nr:patatin-like phospholipase family protein [Candidatus Gracilibacteria bacterium]
MGVMKYLEEKGIIINEISGTSMGAIIGASFALGNNVETSINLAKKFKFWKVFDLDLSLGIVKGQKAYEFLIELFGEKTFDDTIIPLKIVGTNLKTGKSEIFQTGKIVDAIRASTSLPAIFRPYEINQNMYVDGGVLCNLPVDVLEGKNKIGISVLQAGKVHLETMEKNIFGMDTKKGFLSGSYAVIDRCLSIMMELNEENSIKKAGKHTQILRPHLGELDATDFDKVDEFVRVGYDEAKKNLVL